MSDISIVKEVAAAGANAPRVVLEHVLRTEGSKVAGEAAHHRVAPGFDADDHVERVRSSYARLARAAGSASGLAVTLSGMSSTVTGPSAVAITGSVIVGDLVVLSRLQLVQTLKIASAYGHDVTDVDARSTEILALHGFETQGLKAATDPLQKGAQKALTRLLERYLRGSTLQAVKALFRFVGISFTRTGLIKLVPLVNVPLSAALSEMSTRRLGAKARAYYRDLPVAS